jgi:hypothetical protein
MRPSYVVDRSLVAASLYRFWWVVAGIGAAASGWLLWSIPGAFH